MKNIINRLRLRELMIVLGLLTLLAAQAPIVGQYAMVRQISAETNRKISFSIWVERQTIRYGQDFTIRCRVANRSESAIYLVRDKSSQILVERDAILMPEPLVLTGGHEGYDYNFTKVERGEVYESQIRIPADKYNEARPWRLDVGFGYVTDISNLNRQLDPGEDPLPMKALLNSRIETLVLGSLRVEVVKS